MPIAPQSYSAATFKVDRNSIYVFDFDGVIISPEENDIFEYQASDAEAAELSAICQSLHVVGGDLDAPYKRHLVYQAALLKRDEISAVGPAFASFVEACDAGRAFILTARSGPHAIERVRSFLAKHDLRPTEIFHVGRVSKHLQIEYLLRAYPYHKIVYVEDSSRHIESAIANLDGQHDYSDRFHVFEVHRIGPRKSDSALQIQFRTAIREAEAMDAIANANAISEQRKAERALLIDRWKLYAEAAHNEKRWMHERLNWLLISQPVLFAALTFAFQFTITGCGDAVDMEFCKMQKNLVAQIPSVIIALGLTISSLVTVTLFAAGRMHWLWTTSLNKLAKSLDSPGGGDGAAVTVPTVPFGQEPHLPARTSSVIAPAIAIIFILVWIALAFKLDSPPVAWITVIGAALAAILTIFFAVYWSRRAESVQQ